MAKDKGKKPKQEGLVPLTQPQDQIKVMEQIAQEGKGGFVFSQTPEGPIEAYVYIGPQADLEELAELTFPLLIHQYANTFSPSLGQPPMISIFDNELDQDTRELWQVPSTRRRYLGAAKALCDYQQSANGLRFLSPTSLVTVCNCLLGQHTTLNYQWVDVKELHHAIGQFLKDGSEPETLSCILPQQGYSNSSQ